MRTWQSGQKIPHTSCAIEGGKSRKKTTPTNEKFCSPEAADRGEDATMFRNNQPQQCLIRYVGRMFLEYWSNWEAVAPSASHLKVNSCRAIFTMGGQFCDAKTFDARGIFRCCRRSISGRVSSCLRCAYLMKIFTRAAESGNSPW